jgi:16S rRNA (cytosine967-C5)-methyltransferase
MRDTPQFPAGFEARRAAFKLLQAVLWQQRSLDSVLTQILQPLRKPEDRGLARSIASHSLRWLHDLDAIIDSATAKILPDDARARLVLRLALTQKLILNTPDHAIISTALPLVEAGPRRLVHGVLSALFKRDIALPERPSLSWSFESRWAEAYGAEHLAHLQNALASEAPLDLSYADSRFQTENSLMPGHVRLPPATDVKSLPGYDEGHWWVQDMAAQLPVQVLGDVRGKAVLDMCAAPGGKTMQLAARGAIVTALDKSEARLKYVRENLARTKLTATCVAADALGWKHKQNFDMILLDAPCSATGTFRRHPDVLHLRDRADLGSLVAIQQNMLRRAADWLKPGGILVYAVCSLEPEEGEAQLATFADAAPELHLDSISAAELPPAFAAAVTHTGTVRTHAGHLAGKGGCDGFFIARFRRNL